MSNFLKKFKNIVLGKKDSKDVMSSLKDFNAITSSYISVLEEQVNKKEKKVAQIRVLVKDFNPKLLKKERPQISVQTLDMNNTRITEKGKGSYTTKMDWEKKRSQYNQNSKGPIV